MQILSKTNDHLIINKNSRLKTMKFTEPDELYNWRIKNNIIHNMCNNAQKANNSPEWADMMKKHKSEWLYLYGYNKVVYECINTESDTRFYVVEMYDGRNVLFAEEVLMNNLVTLIEYDAEGVVTNMQIERKWVEVEGKNGYRNRLVKEYGVILNKDLVSKRDYIPTLSSIRFNLNMNKDLFKVGHVKSNEINVVGTGMTIEQFNKTQVKINMIGATCAIADLNTLAVVRDYEIYVYTRQKDIDLTK
jgi:uncharacterized protein